MMRGFVEEILTQIICGLIVGFKHAYLWRSGNKTAKPEHRSLPASLTCGQQLKATLPDGCR